MDKEHRIFSRSFIRKSCAGFLSGLFLLAAPALCLNAADEGQGLFEKKCGTCHGLGKSTSKGKTDKQWRTTVLRMIENGADISRDDAEKIIAHLAKNYPKK